MTYDDANKLIASLLYISLDQYPLGSKACTTIWSGQFEKGRSQIGKD